MSSNVEKFSIDVEGENSGKTWKGLFSTKIRLSHRDQLRLDEVRRELLGKNPETASPRAKDSAEAFSFITVHLVDAPQWWTMNGNGLELEDDSVVAEIYKQIIDIKLKAQEKLKADGEAVQTELKKKK